ncbi:MAG: dTDP-glucose 4,6-dehydratase [Candidatus Diapherotrites archaeon]
MKILVTGGAGFIGSNYILSHMQKYPKDKIVNLDKLTYAGNLNNLKWIEKDGNYSFIKGDICNKKTAAKAMKGCDAVINFAAESHVDRSIKNPGEFIETDVFGTFVLLEEAKKQKISKFIQISTDEVYGSIAKGSFTEQSVLNPRNPYSASKAGADRLAYSYSQTYDLNVSIARPSNNFGPLQYPEKLIPFFVTNLLQGEKVPVYGDGKNIRDWLFVYDNCEAIDLILRKGKKGEAYNIAGENEKTNLWTTNFMLDCFGFGKEKIEYVKDRLGHDRRYSMKAEKIKKLGWKPKGKFEDKLDFTIQWYVENSWWWKPLLKKKK